LFIRNFSRNNGTVIAVDFADIEFDKIREDGGQNMSRKAAKIFALVFLFFVNSIFINAQSIYELPSGTKIRVQMDNEINSKVSNVNDTFTTKISQPVKVRETVVLPIGTVIEGRVTGAKRAAIGSKNGSLIVAFETLRFATGEKREIKGVLVNPLTAESLQTANVLTVAGTAALGAIFGSVSKKGTGALIGAAIGTGAGAGVVFLKKGKDVRINDDEEFEIELTKTVTLPVRDY
jgi:outer membrane lipoprotein SlyB